MTGKLLFLQRHAKAVNENPGLSDFDRPLTPRGERAATAVGNHLRERGLLPGLMLCSAARRANDTARLLAEQFAAPVTLTVDPTLYLCGTTAMRAILARLPETARRVMVVAHNPDLGELARTLSGSGTAEALEALQEGFPTAACAVLELGVQRWDALAPGCGMLAALVRPRSLP